MVRAGRPGLDNIAKVFPKIDSSRASGFWLRLPGGNASNPRLIGRGSPQVPRARPDLGPSSRGSASTALKSAHGRGAVLTQAEERLERSMLQRASRVPRPSALCPSISAFNEDTLSSRCSPTLPNTAISLDLIDNMSTDATL